MRNLKVLLCAAAFLTCGVAGANAQSTGPAVVLGGNTQVAAATPGLNRIVIAAYGNSHGQFWYGFGSAGQTENDSREIALKECNWHATRRQDLIDGPCKIVKVQDGGFIALGYNKHATQTRKLIIIGDATNLGAAVSEVRRQDPYAELKCIDSHIRGWSDCPAIAQ